MKISALTSTQVWAASARSLTNFGSGALASTSVPTASLAGAATVDLRTSVGIVGVALVSVITGAGATAASAIDSWDGTTNITLAATAASAGSAVAFTCFNTSAVGPRVRNADATHAASYQVASWVLTI